MSHIFRNRKSYFRTRFGTHRQILFFYLVSYSNRTMIRRCINAKSKASFLLGPISASQRGKVLHYSSDSKGHLLGVGKSLCGDNGGDNGGNGSRDLRSFRPEWHHEFGSTLPQATFIMATHNSVLGPNLRPSIVRRKKDRLARMVACDQLSIDIIFTCVTVKFHIHSHTSPSIA